MTTLTRRLDIYQLYLSRMMALLVGVCALSVFCYLVFLMLAVGHTASRTQAQRSVDVLTAQVGELESQYLREMNSFTPALAAERGFVAPTNVTPIFAQSGNHPLSLQ